MKKIFLLSLLFAFALHGQDDDDDKPAKPVAVQPAKPAVPAVETPADKVVAKIDGKEYTAGQIKKIVEEFPPNIKASFAQNPVRTLNYIFLMRDLAAMGETNKLDQAEDFKQNQAFTRLNALGQAELSYYRNSYRPSHEEEQAFYDKNPDRWDQAKFKLIYVSFSPQVPAAKMAPSPKAPPAAPKLEPNVRTEDEAKARAEDLRKQAQSGADFAQLAKDNSDEKSSAAKGGDWTPLNRFGPYPEALKKVVFALKPGEVSEPVRQPNGFYLYKMESISKQPFNEVESKIFGELQQSHFNDWIKGLESRFTVNVVDNQYFAGKPPR